MPAELKVTITADGKGAEDALKNLQSHLGNVTKAATGPIAALGTLTDVLGKVGLAALGLKAMGESAAAGIQALVGPAADAQAVGAQLDAVLKSTGGAAGMTRDALLDLSNSLSKITPFEDEAIQKGENLLLTFTGIGKDIFPQATEAMLNMSQALGQDLSQSAVQLGKALNDPVAGATALRRVGVSLTEAQQEQIKAFVASGNTMAAQQVILKELETEFGGAAKAAGETFPGKLKILQTQIGNVQEAIGGPLISVLSDAFDHITPLVSELADNLPAAIDSTTQPLRAFAAMVQNISRDDGLGLFQSAIVATELTIKNYLGDEAAGVFHNLIDTVRNVASAAVYLGEAIAPVVLAFGGWVLDQLPAASQLLSDVADKVRIASQFLSEHTAFVGALVSEIAGAVIAYQAVAAALAVASAAQAALNLVMTANPIGLVVVALGALVGALVYTYQNSETFRNGVNAAWDGVKTGVAALSDFWKAHWGQISTVLSVVLDAIGTYIKVGVTFWSGLFTAAMQLISGDWRGAWETIKQTVGSVFEEIKGFFAREMPNLGTMARAIGEAIVQGLGNAIVAGIAWVKEKASQLATGALTAAKEALGIASPSKAFAEIGGYVAEGLADGIEDGAPEVQDAVDNIADAATSAAETSFDDLASAVGASFERAMSPVERVNADLQAKLEDAQIVHNRKVEDLTERLGQAQGKARQSALQALAQEEEDYNRKVEDLQRDHTDRVVEAERQMAQQRGAALLDFQRSYDSLVSDTETKAQQIADNMAAALKDAADSAAQAVQDAQDRAAQSIQDATESQGLNRLTRQRRDAFSDQQSQAQLIHDRQVQDAEDTYQHGVDLARAKRDYDKNLAGAKTKDDRDRLTQQYRDEVANLEQRFNDAKADLAHRRQLEDQEREYRKQQQEQAQAFSDQLENEALNRQIARITDESRTRVNEITRALGEKQAKIQQQAADEEKTLADSFTKQANALKQNLIDKLPGLLADAQATLEAFLEAVGQKTTTVTQNVVSAVASAITSAVSAPSGGAPSGGGGGASSAKPAASTSTATYPAGAVAANQAGVAAVFGNNPAPGTPIYGPGGRVVGHFDLGGIVPGPIGAPMPAIVHGGELILNQMQQRALFSGRSGGASTINFEIPLTVDGRTLARATASVTLDEQNRIVRMGVN